MSSPGGLKNHLTKCLNLPSGICSITEYCFLFFKNYLKKEYKKQKVSSQIDLFYSYNNDETSSRKTFTENYNSITWTPLQGALLQQLYDNNEISMQCNRSNGDRFPVGTRYKTFSTRFPFLSPILKE